MIPLCAETVAFRMASCASVWAEGSGFVFGAPDDVMANTPCFSHGMVSQFAGMCSSCAIQLPRCSSLVEPGMSVGGSENISGCKESGEAMCCRSVFVNALIQFRRATGGSAARCVCLNFPCSDLCFPQWAWISISAISCFASAVFSVCRALRERSASSWCW